MGQPTGVSCGYAMNNMIISPEARNEPRNNRFWAALEEVMTGL